jgi:hypothetical protein
MELFNIDDTVYHKASDTTPMTVISQGKVETGSMITCRWQWFVGSPSQGCAFLNSLVTKEHPISEPIVDGSAHEACVL